MSDSFRTPLRRVVILILIPIRTHIVQSPAHHSDSEILRASSKLQNKLRSKDYLQTLFYDVMSLLVLAIVYLVLSCDA